ncbi:MAG: OmpA family protein [Gemmatimonadaceae bacterium]
MVTTVLDTLTGLVDRRFAGLSAANLGESPEAVVHGYRAVFATILAGLLRETNDPAAMRQVVGLATDRALDAHAIVAESGDAFRDPAAPVPAPATAELGARLLAMLFDDRVPDVSAVVARSVELRPSSIASLIRVASPLALAVLGVRLRESRPSGSVLASLLVGERDDILRALPAGVFRLLDTGVPPPAAERGAATTARALADVPPLPRPPPPLELPPLEMPPFEMPPFGPRAAPGQSETSSRVSRRLWPLVGALALVALLWSITRRGDRAPPRSTAAVRDTQVAAGTVVDTAASGAADLGAFGRRTLPSGVELFVPENGMESRLAGWLADPSTRIGDTAWFDFDRLRFAASSATLEPRSQDQLRDVTAILLAYPHLEARIGGYADDASDATANLRLSRRRAASVRRVLLDFGVPARQLTAEGYGDARPAAGHPRNRIALRVTVK